MQPIILTAISLLVLLPFASSLEFSLDAPSSMGLGEEIEVKVSVPQKSAYDIKIFFENAKGEIVGEIQARDGWRSTRYYLQDVEFHIGVFTVRLKDPKIDDSSLNICIRLREAASTSTPQKQCSPISVAIAEKEEKTVLATADLAPISQSSKNEESPIVLRKEQAMAKYTARGKSRLFINYFIAGAVLIVLFLLLKREQRYREL